ncbi:MAG: 8-oxoguanine DNA glycosylase, N-terminal domain-containing protein [Nanoarchaeota archaeon]|nr:8-oxoguanine DNA glycosylase, N-terminal domain-containing protein [Nanoarchaeota archaeon]
MNYIIKALKFFEKQIKELDKESKKIIHEKIKLIKQNPFRYKKIHSKKYSRVFRIRFNLKQKETRLIYVVINPNIILTCLLDRKKDYKDLEKYLKKIKDELGY